MLFVHEVHKVVGKRAAAFEAAYRDGWMPLLAEGSEARLAWYFDLAHGSGLAYRVVTVTAVADGAACARLAERVAGGDLQSWARHLDGLPARVPRPGPGPAPVVAGGRPVGRHPDRPGHPRALHVHGGHHVAVPGQAPPLRRGGRCRLPAVARGRGRPHAHERGAGARDHARRGAEPRGDPAAAALLLPPAHRLLTNDIPPEVTGPGSWMHEALDLRDQWRIEAAADGTVVTAP